jgi:hypothetical protein
MKSKLWTIATVFAAAVFVFGFAGCDDEEIAEPNYTFSIQYSSEYQAYDDYIEHAWSILQSEDGQEVLDAQTISGDPVIFTNLKRNRATLTTVTAIVYEDNGVTNRITYLTSYLNVPVGVWHYGEKAESILGFTDISVHYPEDYYTNYLSVYSQTPNGSMENDEVSMWEHLSGGHTFHQRVTGSIEDRTITIVSTIGQRYTDALYYCGVLRNQPFNPWGDNHYELELTDHFLQKPIAFSDPAASAGVAFYLNGRRKATVDFGGGLSGYQYLPGFENELCRVDAYQYLDNHCRINSNQFFYGIPDYVTVPEGDISFMYDTSTNEVTQISSNPDAKVFHGSWTRWGEDHDYFWEIYTSSEDGRMSLPQMPDSLITALGAEIEWVLLGSLYAESFNSISSYDDFIANYFDAESPGWIEYDSHYSVCRETGLGGSCIDAPVHRPKTTK